MFSHSPDLIFCRKQPGIAVGRLCHKCDGKSSPAIGRVELTGSFSKKKGKCVICDSFVNPDEIVRICDECNYGTYQGKCVICGGVGVSDAYYCRECTALEKDRDGCPKIINLGMAKKDLYYNKKSTGGMK